MLKKITFYALLILINSISSAFLTACSQVVGNVIPNDGPTMESIYDDTGEQIAMENSFGDASIQKWPPEMTSSHTELPSRVDAADFVQLDNPELKLYVFPHLSGTEMLPVPGYWTAFPAYSRRYYALPLMRKTNETDEVERLNS